MKNIEKIGTKIRITETSEVESSEFIIELEVRLNMIDGQIDNLTKVLQELKDERQNIKKQIKDLG